MSTDSIYRSFYATTAARPGVNLAQSCEKYRAGFFALRLPWLNHVYLVRGDSSQPRVGLLPGLDPDRLALSQAG